MNNKPSNVQITVERVLLTHQRSKTGVKKMNVDFANRGNYKNFTFCPSRNIIPHAIQI